LIVVVAEIDLDVRDADGEPAITVVTAYKADRPEIEAYVNQ
jgi:hypothetical protein